MITFPKTTEFNKRIPKQKFYDNMKVSPALKRIFMEKIRLIYWRNKLAVSTMNISSGETVTEIEVIEIKLTEKQLDEAVLRQIDTEIPYHILFILSFNGKVQAWTGYKKIAENGNKAFNVNKYYHTEWMPENELNLEIKGLNMDTVWDNLIIQVGGIEVRQEKSLDDQIQIDIQKAKLQKEIERLEKQARAEKQPKKKFELVQIMKEHQKELEKLL